MTIFDLVTSLAIATYWNETSSNRIPYIGDMFFPSRKRRGLKLDWIKGNKGLPIALSPSAFDAKATLRDRIGVTELASKMPFFREGMRIGEEDRQDILTLIDRGPQYVQPIIANIFDDVTNLVEGARVQAERMRMMLLYSGAIAISANGASYQYNYDVDGAWAANNNASLLSTAKWSATETSTPISDILAVKRAMATTYGVVISRAILTTKTWGYLMANKSIRLDMDPIGGTNRIMTDSMLQQYLLAKVGITFAIYDKMYKDEAGTQKQFYPDDYVSFLPASDLGSTWYGTTPEEADLMTGNDSANVSIIDTGVAITTIKEAHPVNVFTLVSEIVMPSFERMEEVYVLKVN